MGGDTSLPLILSPLSQAREEWLFPGADASQPVVSALKPASGSVRLRAAPDGGLSSLLVSPHLLSGFSTTALLFQFFSFLLLFKLSL